MRNMDNKKYEQIIIDFVDLSNRSTKLLNAE